MKMRLLAALGVAVLFAASVAVGFTAEGVGEGSVDTKIEVKMVSSVTPGASERSVTVDVRKDDVLMECRETCREEGLSEAHCVGLLELFVARIVEMVNVESSLSYLREGSSNNAILIRSYESDDLTAAVSRMDDGIDSGREMEKQKKAGEYRQLPLSVFYHVDSTNNLGDLWSTYIFIHYANRMGIQRQIDIARESTTTFVTSVGSTLQWLFNRHEVDRRLIASKEEVIHDHPSSGLRTSIGNGFITEAAEESLYDSFLVDIVGVRGPLTRGILNRKLQRYPPVISDPGLLASRIYPASLSSLPPSELKELGFVVHESHRAIFRKLFPAFQDHLIDNHIFLNAQAFFDQLRSYKRVVSSSLHGIIFAHTYGIPVLPVVFFDSDNVFTDSVLGGDFKYMDYYHSVGNSAFARRVPLSQVTFKGLDPAETQRRLSSMAESYWQPQAQTLDALRDLQEGLIMDYLELYRDAHDPALTPSANCFITTGSATAEVAVSGPEGGVREASSNATARMLATRQEHLFWQALAEVYSDGGRVCPQACVERLEIAVFHQEAVNRVGIFDMKLAFPRKFVRRVHGLATLLGKSLAFTFVGHLNNPESPERLWVLRFDDDSGLSPEARSAWPLLKERKSFVKHSKRGRSSRKHLFDYEYYSSLAMANFTLCPAGAFGWTYRFLEAIMAMSIPVVSSADIVRNPHIEEGYFYYTYTPTSSKEEHEQQVQAFVYREEEAQRNYALLLENHVINDVGAGLIRESYSCSD